MKTQNSKRVLQYFLLMGIFSFISLTLQGVEAPVTTVGNACNAVAGQPVTIPVKVTGFTNIYGFYLALEYDGSKLQHPTVIQNAGLTGNLSTNDYDIGGGIHRIVLSWFNSDGLTLPNGSSIVNIVFDFSSGPADLSWNHSRENYCQYNGAAGIRLVDSDKDSHYINGIVSSTSTDTPTITPGGSTTFCAGGSVTLTSSAGASYLWSNAATTRAITVSTAGNYAVTVTYTGGCKATSVVTEVVVNANPSSFAVTGGGSYCAGGVGLPVGLSNSQVGVTYTLYKGTVAQVPTVPGTDLAISFGNQLSGTYYIKASNACGPITMTGSAVITENGIPTISNTTPAARCGTGTVILGATASAETVKWYDAPTGGSLLLTGTSFTTPGISETTTYYVDATSGSCTTASRTAVVASVNAIPTVPTITAGSSTTFCPGGSVTLSSSSATGNQWYLNGSAIVGATSQTYSATGSGSYTVVVTTSGCSSSASDATSVTVNALPIVNAGTDATIPNGTSTTLTATVTGTGTFTYAWTPAAQLVNAAIEDPTTVNLSGTTTFTLTATSLTTGCSNSDAVTITISGGALSSVPTATPSTVCEGSNVQLNAAASGGSGSYTYSWTSNPAGFTSNMANPIANPSVNTTYYVAVNDGYTTVNASVSATVNAIPAKPTISGGPTTFCAGGSVTLTSSAGTSYLWSTGATTSSITVSTAGSYWVKVKNALGCESVASASTTVTVNALPSQPTITAGSSATFCEGGSVTLTSSSGTSYLWSTGATTAGITVSTAGSYWVKVTNATGCQSAASVDKVVIVYTLPVPAIAGNSTSSVGSTGVTYSTEAGMTGYSWGISAGGTITAGAGTNAITVTWNTAGAQSVSVNYINGNGCNASAATVKAVTVVNTNLLASVTIVESANPICAGTSVTFTATPVNGGTPSYVWKKNGVVIPLEAGAIYTSAALANGDQVYVVMTSNLAGVSGSPAQSITIIMTVNSPASQPGYFTSHRDHVYKGQSNVNYTVPNESGVTYTWSYSGKGATLKQTTNSVSISFSKTAKSGYLSVTASNSCGISTALRLYITVDNAKSGSLTGDRGMVITNAVPGRNELRAYPNPSSGPVTFEFRIIDNARATLDISSITGQQIARIFDADVETGIPQTIIFDKSLPSGVYLYVLRWNDQMITGKVIITK